MKRLLTWLIAVLFFLQLPAEGVKMSSTVVGSIVYYPDGHYTKRIGDIYWGRHSSGQRYRGFAKIDLSSIPDDALIQDVNLHFHVTSLTVSTDIPTQIRLVFHDPAALSASNLWNDVGNGTLLQTQSISAPRWYVVRLSNSGIQAVQDSLIKNWIALGWHITGQPETSLVQAAGSLSNLKPYLMVSYTVYDFNPFIEIVSPSQNASFIGPVRVTVKFYHPDDYEDFQFEFQWKGLIIGGRSTANWQNQDITPNTVRPITERKSPNKAVYMATVDLKKIGQWRFRVRSLTHNIKWSQWREFQVQSR